MEDFFSADIGKYKFEIFGFWHFTAIVFFLLVLVATVVFRRTLKLGFKHRITRVIIVSFFLMLDILFHIWKIINGIEGVWQSMLTISLCRLTLYLSFYIFITENEKLFKFLYFSAVGGVLTFAYPTLLKLGPDRFRYYHYFLNHMFFMWVSVYSITVKGYRIKSGDFRVVLKGLMLLAAAVLVIDFIFDQNFMYLRYLPVTIPWAKPLDFFPLYTILFVGAVTGICYLLYLPWKLSQAEQPSESAENTGKLT